jgi:hypothetical protein
MRNTIELNMNRRDLLFGLGATALMGISGCGGSQPHLTNVVDGYTDHQSYRPGDDVSFFLSGDKDGVANLMLADLTGRDVWFGFAPVEPRTPVGNSPWETGFGYKRTLTMTLPDVPSGVYLLNQKIPLLVKTPVAQPVEIVIVYPSNTEAAYNGKGGRSMYTQPIAAPIVSFHRPAALPLSKFCEPFLRWMASQDLPYRIRYVADIDMDDYAEISDARMVVVIGHSEYWTRRARENFDRFVLGGGNALILSGNSMWWQVRYSEDRQKMLCFKNAPDPIRDPLLLTVNWDDPVLKFPIITSIGADFTRGGYGRDKDKGYDGFSVLKPNSPVFTGLDAKMGDVIALPSLEYDGAPLRNATIDNGTPILDMTKLGAYRAEIIGYDYGFRNFDTVGTWMVMQRTATSGTIINGASTDWCSAYGVAGRDGERIRKIILNMFDILVNKKNAFSV